MTRQRIPNLAPTHLKRMRRLSLHDNARSMEELFAQHRAILEAAAEPTRRSGPPDATVHP